MPWSAAERREVWEPGPAIVPSADAGATEGRLVRMQLPADLASCAQTRRFVRSTLHRWGHTGEAVEDAAVVSSELATNAVVHARSRFSVEVRARDGGLRVDVSDGAPAPTGGWSVQRGHGLSIVGALSDRWGVSAAPDGKTVWAELAAGVG